MQKSQTAVDFMTSYGVAIVIIVIAAYVVIRLGIFGGSLAQPACTSAPAFSCGAFAYSANGLLTFVLTQATGGAINVTGVACSTSINSTGSGPQYGNLYVQPYNSIMQFYPNNALQHGLLIYSGSSKTVEANCYGFGGLTTTGVGQPITGYVWMNYTYEGLPPTTHTITRVIQFSTKAS